MINVFEYEKKINENYFVIKFYELDDYFLIKALPFRMWILESYDPQIDNIDLSQFEDYSVADMGNITPLFILTNNCNLACSYCYADEGSYGCDGTFMKADVIKSTFDGLYNVFRERLLHSNTEYFEINAVCFGGEPLLNVDGLEEVLENQLDVCNKLAQEFPAVKFSIKQHINSNGYQISDRARHYLENNKDKIELVFSFDGINHDKHRLSKTGLPSSSDALESIKYYSGLGINTSVTCCLQPDELKDFDNNISYILSVLPHDVSLNFSFLRGSLHFRNINSANKEYLYAIEDVKTVAQTIAKYIANGYNIYNKKFSNVAERAYNYRCPAIGKKEFCIMPDGGIYPCHNFVDNKYTYGDVKNAATFKMKNDKFDAFIEQRTVFDTVGCQNCCMKTICLSNFDCPSHSMFDLGNIQMNDEVVCAFGRIVQKELFLNYVKTLI